MKLLIGSVFAAMLVLAGPALAADDELDEKPVKEKKVCKSYKVTGSLTRVQRICRTESEWRVSLENTKAGVDELQAGAGGGTIPANNPGAGG